MANNQAISTFFTLKIGSILGGVKDVINTIVGSYYGPISGCNHVYSSTHLFQCTEGKIGYTFTICVINILLDVAIVPQ